MVDWVSEAAVEGGGEWASSSGVSVRGHDCWEPASLFVAYLCNVPDGRALVTALHGAQRLERGLRVRAMEAIASLGMILLSVYLKR